MDMKPGETSVFVDWYSFTIGCDVSGNGYENYALYAADASSKIDDLAGVEMARLMARDGWVATRGRRPYTGGYSHDEMGISVWFGGQKTALIEISGRGCEFLRGETDTPYGDMLMHVISTTWDRATRLDFAVDMYVDTSPSDFVACGYNPRIKSSGDLRSATGETFYVGAKKGKSRYARVYRWTSPKYAHRAHLLRCEMVAQKKHAKQHASLVAHQGVAFAAQSMCNYFKWECKDMPKLEDHNEVFSPPVRETSDAGRMSWLKFQVAPAMRELISRGVLTVDELLTWLEVDVVQQQMFDEDDWE